MKLTELCDRIQKVFRPEDCCCTKFYWCVECKRHTDEAPTARRSLGYCSIHGPHPGVARPLWWEGMEVDVDELRVDFSDGEFKVVEP